MRKSIVVLVSAALLSATGCAGVRETQNTFVAHAEAFRILGTAIPEDDLKAARDQVPAGARIETVVSSPADWTSVLGFFGNVFGFTRTVIGGTK